MNSKLANTTKQGEIEKRLSEKITTFEHLKETSCSRLYRITGANEYVAKETKSGSIAGEFEHHKLLYQLWIDEKASLDFIIPKVYFLSEDETFYVMEFVQCSFNMQSILNEKHTFAVDIFSKAGQCCNQLHQLLTKYMFEKKKKFSSCNLVLDIKGHSAKKINRYLTDFNIDELCVIVEDLKPSNILIDDALNVYFIDFQHDYYSCSFYYDLARFTDTAKLFAFLKNPIYYVFHLRYINDALGSFLKGHQSNLNKDSLIKMRYVHRKLHVQRKFKAAGWLDAMVLRLIYCFIL